MVILRRRFPLPLLARLFLFCCLGLPLPSYAAGNRDILWEVVTTCLDPAAADYDTLCRWPAEGSAAACRKTTGVWEISRDFVILRDRKMCDCLDNATFVHGLAIPRTRVTGAEDPRRPDGIWRFAWEYAVRRIGKEEEIALVANPPGSTNRSQDQLHVHIVRLSAAGAKLRAVPGQARVQNLDDVWKRAVDLAAGTFEEFGVLVAKHPQGGFLVVVDDRNLEHLYTESRCP